VLFNQFKVGELLRQGHLSQLMEELALSSHSPSLMVVLD
jgi:hypothetical protein